MLRLLSGIKLNIMKDSYGAFSTGEREREREKGVLKVGKTNL